MYPYSPSSSKSQSLAPSPRQQYVTRPMHEFTRPMQQHEPTEISHMLSELMYLKQDRDRLAHENASLVSKLAAIQSHMQNISESRLLQQESLQTILASEKLVFEENLLKERHKLDDRDRLLTEWVGVMKKAIFNRDQIFITGDSVPIAYIDLLSRTGAMITNNTSEELLISPNRPSSYNRPFESPHQKHGYKLPSSQHTNKYNVGEARFSSDSEQDHDLSILERRDRLIAASGSITSKGMIRKRPQTTSSGATGERAISHNFDYSSNEDYVRRRTAPGGRKLKANTRLDEVMIIFIIICYFSFLFHQVV